MPWAQACIPTSFGELQKAGRSPASQTEFCGLIPHYLRETYSLGCRECVVCRKTACLRDFRIEFGIRHRRDRLHWPATNRRIARAGTRSTRACATRFSVAAATRGNAGCRRRSERRQLRSDDPCRSDNSSPCWNTAPEADLRIMDVPEMRRCVVNFHTN